MTETIYEYKTKHASLKFRLVQESKDFLVLRLQSRNEQYIDVMQLLTDNGWDVVFASHDGGIMCRQPGPEEKS